MSRLQTRDLKMERDALEELANAAQRVDLQLVEGPRNSDLGPDAYLVTRAGDRLSIEVKRLSLASADGLSRRLGEWTARAHPATQVRLVVADRVTASARDILQEAGWSWLDLRGHLHVIGPGLFVDAEMPATDSVRRPADPLAGRVGLEVATTLLMRPSESPGVRQLAAELGRAASSVSKILAGLRDTQLADEQNRPAAPELFWELAKRWRSPTADLATLPSDEDVSVGRALLLGLDDPENKAGWALGDTLAAAAYGAPVGARADHPPDLYVPDEARFRRAVRLLGTSSDHAARVTTIRVAPVAAVCTHRVDPVRWTKQAWPLAHPLFVALDLAGDSGRGREILEGWNPPAPWHRVW